jgi:hypothetical protein
LLIDYQNKWKYVLILRDPVQRFISHYTANYFKKHSHDRIDLSLEEYIKTDRALEFGQDYITNLTGRSSIGAFKKVDESTVKEAIENLSFIHIKGKLEQIDRFSHEFKKTVGRAIKIQHRNRNPGGENARNMTIHPEIMAKIQTICSANQRIYDCLTD